MEHLSELSRIEAHHSELVILGNHNRPLFYQELNHHHCLLQVGLCRKFPQDNSVENQDLACRCLEQNHKNDPRLDPQEVNSMYWFQ